MRKRATYSIRAGRALAVAPKAHGVEFDSLVFGGEGDPTPPFTVVGPYAVVDVCGPLEQHAGWFADDYDSILVRVAAALESAAPEIVLRINSPGGDFAGSLEASRALRAMARGKRKRLCVFVDGSASSAAYALASAADEIVVTPSGTVGSIGVWQALIDATAADAMMGARLVLVASGARKLDHNPHVAISEGAIAATQAQIDAMAGLFFACVAEHRGIPVDDVAALEGGEAFGVKAVSLRLADSVVDSWSAFLTRDRVQASQSGVTATMAKGTSYEEARKSYRASLAAAAAEDSDDGKKARSALVAMDKEDEKNAKRAEDEGSDEPKKDEADAKAQAADEPPKKDEADAKAQASTEGAQALAIARELQRRAGEDRARAEAAEKTTLLASRPDLDPAVRKFLEGQPLASVREAVESFPRAAARAAPYAPAAGAGTMPATQGKTQGSPDEGSWGAEMDRIMGRGIPVPSAFSVGSSDTEGARQFLKDLDEARRAAAQGSK